MLIVRWSNERTYFLIIRSFIGPLATLWSSFCLNRFATYYCIIHNKLATRFCFFFSREWCRGTSFHKYKYFEICCELFFICLNFNIVSAFYSIFYSVFYTVSTSRSVISCIIRITGIVIRRLFFIDCSLFVLVLTH